MTVTCTTSMENMSMNIQYQSAASIQALAHPITTAKPTIKNTPTVLPVGTNACRTATMLTIWLVVICIIPMVVTAITMV